MLQAGEENGNPVRLHVRMLRNELILTVQGVQVQQVVGLAQHFAALVQFSDGDAHVIQLGMISKIDDLLCAQGDPVHLCQGRQEDDRHRGRRREAADWETSFNHPADAHPEAVVLLQHLGGAAQVIGPVPHFPGRDALDMPLRHRRPALLHKVLFHIGK